MIYFCTFFDSRFLARGLALYRSIIEHMPGSTVYVLTMDTLSYDYLSALKEPSLRVIDITTLEKTYATLESAKHNRTAVEFYYTCKPFLIEYIFVNCADARVVIYVDADVYFFANIIQAVPQIAQAAVTLTPHRFSLSFKHKEANGLYNAGWISFNRSPSAFKCLTWWADKCVEWCYEKNEQGRYGDQAYLTAMTGLFEDVYVTEHPGANVAPWNSGTFNITTDALQQPLVDGAPLLFYHFHALRKINKYLYDTRLTMYDATTTGTIWRTIFRPYIDRVVRENQTLPESVKRKLFTNNRKQQVRILGFTIPIPDYLSFLRLIAYLPKGISMKAIRFYLGPSIKKVW